MRLEIKASTLLNSITCLYNHNSILVCHQARKNIYVEKRWGPVIIRKRKSGFCKSVPTSAANNNNAYDTSDAHSSSADQTGSTEKDGKSFGESLTSTEILKKLQRYGVSGVLSYGLLNTAYYLTAFLLVWFYIAPAPGKMGFRAAAERWTVVLNQFLKMMAVVWAGSQVTKLFRAAGALALAPFVDRGLSWFTVKFKFQSQGKAFLTIVGFCLGLAVALFLIVTLLSA